MPHDGLKPKVKIKATLLMTAVLLCTLLVYSSFKIPIKTILANIQVTLIPKDLKTLQNAQQSLSLTHVFYTPDQLLNEWLRLENKDTSWHKPLPECPKAIILKQQPNGEALVTHPNPEIWYPVTPSGSLHGKATYEIRSLPVENSSSQCTYDQNGALYKHEVPEAGSSDFYSPSVNKYLHHIYDVEPYILARALKRSEDYYKARPPK